MGVCSLPETAAACGLHGCLAQEETPRRCRRDRRAPARSGLRARVLPPRQPSGVWGAGFCRHSRAHEKTGPWAAARRAGTLDECPTCLSSSGDAGSWAWRPSPRGAAGTSHTGARAGQAALSSGAPGARGCQALSLLRRAGAIGFSGSAQKAGTLGCANSFAP